MSAEHRKETGLTPPALSPETQLHPKPVGSRPSRRSIPEGLWTKCKGCDELIFDKDLEAGLKVCPACGYHFYMGARSRIAMLIDEGTFEERDALMESVDVLGFPATRASWRRTAGRPAWSTRWSPGRGSCGGTGWSWG